MARHVIAALLLAGSAAGCAESETPGRPMTPAMDDSKDAGPKDKDPQNGGPGDQMPSAPGVFLDAMPEPPRSGRNGGDEPTDTHFDLANCPVDQPREGETCDKPPLVCSYGTERVAGCRVHMLCRTEDPVWRQANIRSGCIQPPEGRCPAEMPQGACMFGQDAASQAPCVYGEGTYCYCEYPDGWACKEPPGGCPAAAPNFRDACAEQGLGCEYGDPCRGGLRVICREGYWQPVGYACP